MQYCTCMWKSIILMESEVCSWMISGNELVCHYKTLQWPSNSASQLECESRWEDERIPLPSAGLQSHPIVWENTAFLSPYLTLFLHCFLPFFFSPPRACVGKDKYGFCCLPDYCINSSTSTEQFFQWIRFIFFYKCKLIHYSGTSDW